MQSVGALAIVAVALAGCGGGGGGGGSSGGGGTTNTSGYKVGVFDAESKFANQCAAPRSGTDPTTGKAFLDTQGTATTENNWLRSWSHDLYLWYSEMPDIDPSTMTTANYFAALKTSATTASGAPKDKFHFTYKTSDWVQLSQSGVQVGYGLEWFLIANRPPRNVVVAYTDPAIPAANANKLARGTKVLTADGIDVVNDNTSPGVATINEAFFPTAAASHTFVVQDVGSSTQRTVTLTASSVTETPVQNAHVIDSNGVKVGYVLFNDHTIPSEQGLIDAINTLKAGNATELVLDIRYNGGGYLAIASELAYMIAGSTRTAGQTFDKIAFNDQHPTTDPVAGGPITPTPFLSSTNFATPATALPTLSNLNRVFVLTGPDTCSASEAIMNGLNGIGMPVIQIGSTTCGKPYGFYPQDNCGTTYFTIEFKGVNAANFGDYTDGFTPQNSSVDTAKLPGCSVADDFNHALGDVQESRLATAITYIGGAGCPAATGIAAPGLAKQTYSDVNSTEPGMVKPPWRTNRIY